MKRPALLIGFPYILGLVLASVFERQLWLPVCGGVILVVAAVLLWRRDLWKYVLLGTLSCLTACCVYWQRENMTYERQKVFAGKETTFTGQVSDVTLYQSGYARYYLDGMLNDSVPARVELFCHWQDYGYEERLTFSGKPELMKSNYLYDTEGHARAKGIFLKFYMPKMQNSFSDASPTLRSVIYNWRKRMTERIQRAMGEETGALMTGMLFGDRSGMSHSSQTALYRMGIGHVLAVSGLHLDFLALCVSWILERLRCGRKLKFLLMAVVCCLFVICVGETVSVKRACSMVLLRESAGLVFRRADSLNSLSIAAFLLGVENPFVVHSAAFWLSCTATYGISVAAPYMTKEMPAKTFLQKQKRNFLMSCWAFAVLLPVCAYYFREVSLISPISNTLLVPVCMLSLLLGMLAVICGASSFPAMLLLSIADFLNTFILDISDFIARIPWTHAGTGSSLLMPLLLAGVLLAAGLLVMCRDKRLTSCAVLISLAMTCITVGTEHYLHGNELHLAILGSGRDCVLVLTAGDEAIVADLTGGSQAAVYAEAYLTKHNILQVETLYFCQPSGKSASRYDACFAFLPPEETVQLDEKEMHREQLFHGARLTAGTDSVLVEYAGVAFVCARDAPSSGIEPEVLAVYGKKEAFYPPCGILIILDEDSSCRKDGHTHIGENNLELTITKDGTCRIRRLYGVT